VRQRKFIRTPHPFPYLLQVIRLKSQTPYSPNFLVAKVLFEN
jgi:hypothetical protein